MAIEAWPVALVGIVEEAPRDRLRQHECADEALRCFSARPVRLARPGGNGAVDPKSRTAARHGAGPLAAEYYRQRALNEWDTATFYGAGAKGYTDY